MPELQVHFGVDVNATQFQLEVSRAVCLRYHSLGLVPATACRCYEGLCMDAGQGEE